jgi:hypothetical protein
LSGAPVAGVRVEKMRNRIETFAVYCLPDAFLPDALIGFYRIDPETGNLVTRTCGSETDAADIRRFQTVSGAVRWLRRRAQILATLVTAGESSP